ncbi:ArsR family transcriptional regulator [Cryobacterium sp. TMT2-15-1]|uniref:helix-turn-helix transcriptional regulator n=1 Tax=Cryobacterium sp. TMT2-15-1 TaxID=1259246 RepID=UPI00106C411F|nr:helix-turn-helix domain-containing protein [Cryobacterium sp. TMT2-15-1]TFC59783.1 ArsR family transcriptional regulator [Cryobacterium sp. TMT2-15-1]
MPIEPLDARTHRVLSGISRVAILELLRDADAELDVPAIAQAVGLHANTVRSHLDRLVEVGLVAETVEARVRPGRPRLFFRATSPAAEVPAESYRLLAGLLAGGLGRDVSPGAGAGAAAEAGRRWGREMAETDAGLSDAQSGAAHGASVGRIVQILDEVGFEPRLGAAAGSTPAPVDVVIELHRCPFLDVAKDHSDVVCAVHRGLMEGALERLHTPGVGVTLEPFARPGVCLAHLEVPATKP